MHIHFPESHLEAVRWESSWQWGISGNCQEVSSTSSLFLRKEQKEMAQLPFPLFLALNMDIASVSPWSTSWPWFWKHSADRATLLIVVGGQGRSAEPVPAADLWTWHWARETHPLNQPWLSYLLQVARHSPKLYSMNGESDLICNTRGKEMPLFLYFSKWKLACFNLPDGQMVENLM